MDFPSLHLQLDCASTMSVIQKGVSGTKCHAFSSCDLDPMTLMYELLNILKMYLHAKNELYRSRLSKVAALQTDRHTDRRDRTHCYAVFADGNK